MTHTIKSDSNVNIPESGVLQGKIGKLYKKLPDSFPRSVRIKAILSYVGIFGKINSDAKTVEKVIDICQKTGRNNTFMTPELNNEGDKIAETVHSFMNKLSDSDCKAFAGKLRAHKRIKTLTLENVKDDTKAA